MVEKTEVVEVTERIIVPTSLPATMTVIAPNGKVVEAPIEAWIYGLMTMLPESQQGSLCEKVEKIKVMQVKPVISIGKGE